MRSLLIIFNLILFSSVGQSQNNSWTFASYPDFHSGDWDLREDLNPDAFSDQHKVIADIASFNPEFLLLTGDMIGGMWLNNEHLRKKYGAEEDLKKFIHSCAVICYEGVNSRFAEHGLKVYGCVGDHEVGDQNWEVNSIKSLAVRYFKEAFASAYTLGSKGESLFTGLIGSVPQRPAGTPYENTSYAFIHKNVMVVTVDIFTQDSPFVPLHPVRGTVYPDITGGHQKWLDDVLEAGNSIDSVDFIIVQSHFPVLLPVRKHQTSHMTVLNEEESAFWNILKKHKVDVYLAGEVHALTPSIDNQGGIIQIVHGSFNNYPNPLLNYLITEVSDDKLTIFSREKKYENDFHFQTTGQLIIDKTSGEKVISGAGALTPVDREGLLVHYGFEDLAARIENTGLFGPKILYGISSGVKVTDGIIGQGIEFPAGAEAYSKSFGVNPFHADMARTFACWIKTVSGGRMTLITTGRGTFTLQLDNGLPQLVTDDNTITLSDRGNTLNDNKWHHIAVTFPGKGHLLEDICLYVDGEKCDIKALNSDAGLNTSPDGFFIVGSSNDMKSDFFVGSMDEVSAWSSALTESMIRVFYNSAASKEEKYDAASIDSLFRIFRAKGKGKALDGKTWSYSSDLEGEPGTFMKRRNRVNSLVLGPDGEGLRVDN
ncbi:MAG: metallophosphoesterase [Bacteroidales bacterium]|nr:metallophosphoesterase [Bacteroidales bacterium]